MKIICKLARELSIYQLLQLMPMLFMLRVRCSDVLVTSLAACPNHMSNSKQLDYVLSMNKKSGACKKISGRRLLPLRVIGILVE